METRSETKIVRMLVICALSACMLAGAAHAELYIFGQITGTDGVVCPDAFTMEVVEDGDQALFTFTNNCDSDGVLGRIFVKDSDLMTFNSIFDQSDGVCFSDTVKRPAMLPGGHALGFTPHNTYAIYAEPARPKNGLHHEDFVTVLFDISGGSSFGDIIASLNDESLGVGIHAQSLPGGSSAAFTATPIPEPLTLSLLGMGALLIRNKRRGTAQ